MEHRLSCHCSFSTEFEDSPGLREQIEQAVEERDARRLAHVIPADAVDNTDLPQIERLLRFWRARGCSEMWFRIVR